jgi:hypothetical protein
MKLLPFTFLALSQIAAAAECGGIYDNSSQDICLKTAAETEMFLNDMGSPCTQLQKLFTVPDTGGFTVVTCTNLRAGMMYEINGPGACTPTKCEVRLVDYNTMRIDLLYAEQEWQAQQQCMAIPACRFSTP